MKIAIAGANGLIGTALVHRFVEQGHELTLLVRKPFETIHHVSLWNPFVGEIPAADLEGCDVVINLAGKNIAAERWSERHKRDIVESRVQATSLIARTIAKLARKPRLLLQASAVGFYGNRPGEALTEASPVGSGFMASACEQWERSAAPADAAGVRVCYLRIGVVLAKHGGALDKMLPIFRLGLGGRFGDGKMMMSWISLTDIVAAIEFLISNDTLNGPINLTAPHPVSNEDFTHALGKALHRPAFMAVPEFALKLAAGEMASELLLASQEIKPQRLQDAGFAFMHPRIDSALAAVLAQD